ncbi:MAG TPA: asparagine synthase (glutamine-hydrolyzing) [Terriglobales bacterium]|nr:asparagine synthase (glutamine-hydrolyzing) [Terriglobales bacterium]
MKPQVLPSIVCGIVGILARGCSVSADMLQRATQSLAHRGPDDAGTTIILAAENLEVGLGSRRLAVLDLSSSGHQPMSDPQTDNWIVYNGEVYNFREIRSELEKRGVHFQSGSDTEVVLKAYGEWGTDFLPKLRGMFAFAIWDGRQRRLLVARDPMGIKPLYYSCSETHLIFASEIRALLSTGLVRRAIDHAGIFNYLTFGSVYEPNTMVRGISALQGGYFLTWEQGNIQQQQMYCDLVDRDAQGVASTSWDLREELFSTVRSHLVSDVPVGIFLSGGMDSSALAAILNASSIPTRTISLAFGEAEFDEASYAREIAKQFRTDHHEIVITENEALDTVPDIVQAMDQPSVDGVNTYLVSRSARKAGIKVALSGLGGDELFGGYSSFKTVPRMERFHRVWHHLPDRARRSASGFYESLARPGDQGRKISALIAENGRLIHPYFLSRMLFTPKYRKQLFPFAAENDEQRANAPLRQSVQNAGSLHPVNRVSYLEARCYMLNTLLRDSDVMSMAHGLELRVPFADFALAKKILNLSGDTKLGNGVPKPLLVHALQNALPDSIVQRPKHGFTLPFERWLKGKWEGTVEATLEQIPDGPLREILDVGAVKNVWRDFVQGEISWSRPWSLFVLQRWCELNL